MAVTLSQCGGMSCHYDYHLTRSDYSDTTTEMLLLHSVYGHQDTD